MAIIKITESNGKISLYNLLGYSIYPKKEEHENVRFLEINTSVSLFKYRIWCEADMSDINEIEEIISDKFINAFLNNKIIYLEEDSTRGFITICDNNDLGKQFGGRRL